MGDYDWLAKFQQKLLDDVYVFYKDIDYSHGMGHITDVVNNVKTICDRIYEHRHLKTAMIAAAYHDIYANDRDSHHVDAYMYIINNAEDFMKRYMLNRQDLYSVAHAVLEHRGSWTGGYYSMVSEIVAAADRGIPTKENTVPSVGRAYAYARDALGKSIDEAIEHTIHAYKSKLGRDTLGTVPGWYHDVFAEELELRYQLVDTIDRSWFTPERIKHFETLVNS